MEQLLFIIDVLFNQKKITQQGTGHKEQSTKYINKIHYIQGYIIMCGQPRKLLFERKTKLNNATKS